MMHFAESPAAFVVASCAASTFDRLDDDCAVIVHKCRQSSNRQLNGATQRVRSSLRLFAPEHDMSAPSCYTAQEKLKHGAVLTIRAARPDDRMSVASAVRALSPESIYLRLFSHRRELTE